MLLLILYLLLFQVIFTDFKYRLIHNSTNIAVLVTSICILLVYKTNLPIPLLSLYAIMLPACFLLFYFNIWGGGDAKLVLALIPALNISLFLEFLLLTSLIGAMIAVATLLYYKIILNHAINISVPYGIPIALSAMYQLYPLWG